LSPAGNLTYTRNTLGQVTQIVSTNPAYTQSFTYDSAHRLTQVADSRGNKSLNYAYSPGGLLNSLSDNQSNRTDYLYDGVGRLIGLWAPNYGYMAFSHDAGGRLTEKWFPNGVTANYAWNPDGSLKQLVNRATSSTILSQHDYVYDGVGNRANHTENIAGASSAWSYAYDELNRLTQANNGVQTETYGYDRFGNRVTKQIGAGTPTVGVFDPANQLLELRSGSVGGAILSGFVYDADGNLTKKCEGGTVTRSATDCTGSTATNLTWDALNRLAQVAKTGLSTETYAYDHEGRRIAKTVSATQTNYLYNGPDIHGEYSAAYATQAIYVHGPNMDDPLIRLTGTTNDPNATASYYHQDGLGSIVGLTNNVGTTLGTQRFDAWGNKVASPVTVPSYGYTGREPDATGLVQYRARYYDPSIGRFISKDPAGMPDGVNRYAYVANSPTNYVDPTGLRAADPLSTWIANASGGYIDLSGRGLTSAKQNLGQVNQYMTADAGAYINGQL